MPLLTTITSYWSRPQMLEVWLEAIRGCGIPEVEHILFNVGNGSTMLTAIEQLRIISIENLQSIGHAHNFGAKKATTEWIMKLDVDTLPSLNFFRELMPVLEQAKEREWFNCGMFYFKQPQSQLVLGKEEMPIVPEVVAAVTANPRAYVSGSYHLPAATNFICRRADYLVLGGCDPRFDGYGWEDYQQIYMLERHQIGVDPLPGLVTLQNVTHRCRDEISRRKARELFERNKTLCLFHRWHPPAEKNRVKVDANRKVLLDYIEASRKGKQL